MVNVNFLAVMASGSWFTGSGYDITAWISNTKINTTLLDGTKISTLSNLNENLVVGFSNGSIAVAVKGNVSNVIFLTGHTSSIVAFANSSTYSVSASLDQQVIVWNSTANIVANFNCPGIIVAMKFFA